MSRQLVRNSAANFAAAALPAVAMLVTLPLIVRFLGVEDYGVLTMVMAITGYFAVVDINVTAGSVKYISEYHAKRDLERVYQVVSFGALFYLVLGFVGAVGIYLAAPWAIAWLFELPPDKIELTIEVMRLAALGFLFGQLQVYLNSIPQALHRFDLTALLESFFGTLIPVFSVFLLWQGYGLKELVVLRVAGSALHGLILVAVVLHVLPGFRLRRPTAETASKLWGFSGYAYLNRLAAMTYAQADKIIVGSLLGMSALAHYSVATQIIGRITGLTFRLTSVLYPAASAMEARGEMDHLKRIYFTASRYITFLNGATILLVCLYGREILHYWMGPEFATEGYWVMVFMAVAMFVDSLTTIPSLLNDAFGKPRNTGIFALLRVVFATVMTYFLARNFDLDVVAVGQTLSALVFGFGFVLFIHGRSIPWPFAELVMRSYVRPFLAFVVVLIVGVLLRQAPVMELHVVAGEALICAFLIAALGYFWVLQRDHRHYVISFLPFIGPLVRK